jgi:hypothetical protein
MIQQDAVIQVARRNRRRDGGILPGGIRNFISGNREDILNGRHKSPGGGMVI